jgi:hypothetical protein
VVDWLPSVRREPLIDAMTKGKGRVGIRETTTSWVGFMPIVLKMRRRGVRVEVRGAVDEEHGKRCEWLVIGSL